MICRQCGADNPENLRNCAVCQKPLEQAGKPEALSLDDLIKDSVVVAQRLIEPAPVQPPPPPEAPVDPAKWKFGETPVITARTIPKVEPTPIPRDTDEPLPHDIRPGFLSYRRPDTKVVVFAPLAGYWRRLGAAVYDNLLLAVLIAFPGAFLVLYLASQTRFFLVPYRWVLVDTANEFARPTLVWFVVLFTLISFPYYLILTTLNGQTSGKRYWKIRVATADGRSPRLLTAFIRTLYGVPVNLSFCAAVILWQPLFALIPIPIYLGILTIFTNPMRQAVHDKFAQTYVIRDTELVEDIDF